MNDSTSVAAALRGDTEALRDALHDVGLSAQLPTSGDDPFDLVLTTPGGDTVIAAQVKRVSLADINQVRRQLLATPELLSEPGRVSVVFVVADRVTKEARQELSRAGWAWLDLRGHLYLATDGIFVNADVPSFRPPTGERLPLTGRVGLEVASALLMNPDGPVVVRDLARRFGRSPSSVSEVLKRLQTAGLVTMDRTPVVPDLFAALAARWPAEVTDLADVPEPGRNTDLATLRVGLDDIQASVGWALTDTLAAAAYGAPVGVRSAFPPDFYVPDVTTVRRALHLLGPARNRAERGGTLRVAPVPTVCAQRVDATAWTSPSDQIWPLAHPLFVALDLAQDPARGKEILDAWTPPDPWHRVW